MKKKWFKLLLTFILLAYLIYVLVNNYQVIIDSLELSFLDLLAISVLHIIFLVVSAKRFLLVISINSKAISFYDWFVWFIEARLLNKIFPQLGNIYRGVKLKETHDISLSSYSGSYIFFTWIDTLINFTIAGLAILFLSGSLLANLNILLFVVLPICVLAVLPFMVKFLPRFSAVFPAKLYSKISSLLLRLNELTTDFLRSKKFVLLLLLGVVAFCSMSLRIGIGFSVYGVSLSLVDLFVLYAFYKVATMIVLTPGNVGVQELSIASVAVLLGHDFAIGVAVSILLRVYGYIVFFFLWIVFYLKSVLAHRGAFRGN